ncbi:MAG TPA: 23S rRNA (adenine(2503)-C(2))-methyltransferase RlmN [Prolixibacteraceae bacterium]|nr:23S rRNA (adenine(2503)-C(2))-methyltransferase RlmN [Prolixibacteraceae bacterium]
MGKKQEIGKKEVGSRKPEVGSQHPTSSIQHPCRQCIPAGRQHRTSSIPASNTFRQAGSIEHPVSNIPASNAFRQAGSIEHPASSIQHPASSIEHPASQSPLFGKTLAELTEVVTSLELPKFTAKQIANWLYKKEITSIEEMSNLSKAARNKLAEKYEVGVVAPVKVQVSRDGTKKYLFPTLHDKFIETAMIPDKDRITVCVSSQVGCKMGCLFCMTGKQGFNGQLTAGEILNQLRMIDEHAAITNIVYMGMGEPFDNLDEVMKSIEILTAEWGYAMSPRRITVSSIGIIPGLKRFLNESSCNVAISLHTPFDIERQKLMPVQQAYPIEKVIAEIRSFTFDNQRKLSFEYIVFGGLNDTPAHVKEMARLLNGVKSHVNLIRFHPIPGTPLNSTNENQLQEFKDQLNKKGILTTIRASRGQDIYAACGLLSTKGLVKS